MSYSDDFGETPWSFSSMVEAYPVFKDLYTQRPVRENRGGMLAPHAFMLWFILSRLKPDLIIESGIWKGQGTWLIEQACPDAELICLDINLSRLEYKSKSARYFEGDFSNIELEGYNLSNALCFFDDHQNALMRMQQMKWKGIAKAIFEDNYPVSRGDCYSIKQILAGQGFASDMPRAKKYIKALTYAAFGLGELPSEPIPMNSAHAAEFRRNAKVYFECPPLFRTARTRWGDDWSDDRYPTKPALFDTLAFDDLSSEAQAFNWMCYVELKQ